MHAGVCSALFAPTARTEMDAYTGVSRPSPSSPSGTFMPFPNEVLPEHVIIPQPTMAQPCGKASAQPAEV